MPSTRLGAVFLIAAILSGPGRTDPTEAIGSTRNARVAYAMPADGKKVELTFLAGEVPDGFREEMAKLVPNVRLVTGLSSEQAVVRASEAHGVEARFATEEFLEKAPNLVWVQAMSAGVDRYVANPGLRTNDRIVLTNMRGVHGPAIADHAMAMLLSLTRNLRPYARAQEHGEWSEITPTVRSAALEGRTMLVVGIGGIGSEVARRAHGFGMRVLATRRSEAPAPDYVERVGKPGDLLKMLPEADVVVICAPLTPETERLFDARTFASMKTDAILVNVARGRIVDTNALLAALRSGRLAGACLDVTDPEPLPADHPLWKQANVVITPHVAADAVLTEARRLALFRENLRRFGAGEPLLNVVDKKAGY